MQEETSLSHIRPRFDFLVPLGEEEALQRIDEEKAISKEKVIVRVEGDHVKLDVPINERHYWSPQISFRVESDEENPERSRVKGVIGPRPAVWTMFTLIYLAIGTLGISLSFYGISKWMLGNFSNLVWALPISLLLMLSAYKAGKIGEKLGHDQVEVLKGFIDRSLLGKKADINS